MGLILEPNPTQTGPDSPTESPSIQRVTITILTLMHSFLFQAIPTLSIRIETPDRPLSI